MTSLLEELQKVRQSRRFTEEPVTDEQLETLLEVAQWTGSSRNTQPWHFIVIRDKDQLRKVSEVRGEVIEAHVVVRQPGSGTAELAAELQQFVKTRYAAHAYPRTVHFHDALPKTPSGKVQRYLLRARPGAGTPS